jgi:hypothetical protein
MKLPPELRALALPDFEPVTFGALWRGKVTPLIQCFLDATVGRAQAMLGGNAEIRTPQPETNSKR